MPDVNPGWLAALITMLVAVTGGIFTFKSSKAQAQPDAQQSINAGFTALSDRQADEIKELRQEVAQIKRTASAAELKAEHADDEAESARLQASDARRQINVLASHVADTTSWHGRHMGFDTRAKEIIEQVAPDEAPNLPALEPFPELPHELRERLPDT